ncbi:MAG: hypothetical protein R3B12_03455 [Candidatus Saccharimonadales bacterium]
MTEKAVPLATIRIDDDGKTATIGGSISDLRQITTKNGQAMAFVQVEDIVGDQIEVVVFPRVLEANSASIVKDKVVLVKGRVNSKDKAGNAMAEPKLIADTFMLLSLDEAKAYQPTGVKTSLGKPKKPSSRPPIDTPSPRQNVFTFVCKLIIQTMCCEISK